MEELRQAYLDLMKKCLTCFLWETEWRYVDPAYPRPLFQKATVNVMTHLLSKAGVRLVREAPVNTQLRLEGLDHPPTADTMIGLKRLDNLQFCVEDVIKNNVPGDLIETGVWRGGATIFMRAVLKAYQATDRRVWVADSFAGLPKPDAEKYPVDDGDQYHTYEHLRVSLEQVQANFLKYELLDDQVRFLKGWFKDTLKTAPFEKLAVMRLDGDMYESTMDALVNLYPKLSVGGYVIIDDYALHTCREAVKDFREDRGITDEIKEIDWTGVFWQRTEA